MTQHSPSSFPYGMVLLVVAALLAAFSIGFNIYSPRSTGSETAIQSVPAPLEDTIESLEARTRDQPQDVQAWQKLGLFYFEAGRFGDAVQAYREAVSLDPDEPLLWSSLGEAMVMASERNPMPDDAVAAFRKTVSLDPKDPRARYFLAVKRDLSGDHQGALDAWLALLEETPLDAPWRNDLVRTIDQVGKINKIDVSKRLADAGAKSPAPQMPAAARGIPGPSAQDLANASKIPPGEQRDMAEDMVSRLEKRLESDPANVDGWVMLMRSRKTLGQHDKARKALRDAVAANPGKADFLKQQAGVLGLR
jgi:cytochrome c-type biogenesis protein CcmH